MNIGPLQQHGVGVTLRSVSGENWRDVAKLVVTDVQRAFVAEPSYYLALCCYGTAGWQPLAIHLDEQVIGFLMWAVDPADLHCWLGGVLIDRAYQGKGYGKQALQKALTLLGADYHQRAFALSYQPANGAARRLYASLGFVETGEREGDEVVARLSLPESEGSV